MAIALGLDPAWTGPSATTNLATAAFSPAAGSLIIIDAHIDLSDATLATQPVITDSVGLTWTAIGTPQRGSSGGWNMAWWAYTASAQTNMTVAVNWGGSGANKTIKPRTFTGTATTSAVISKAQAASGTNNLTVSVTTTNDGCRIAGSAIDWNARGLPVSTDDEISYHLVNFISGCTVQKAANSSGVGTSVSLNFDGGGTQATVWSYKIYEIVPAPAGGAIDLVPAGASQAMTSDSPTLTQVHVLAPSAAVQAQTSDSPALMQVHNLAPDAAVQAQTSDAPSLTQVHNLVTNPASQAQTAESPTLTQVHSLTPDNASQVMSSDSPTLSQSGSGSLVVADATQAMTSDNVTLTQVHVLAVDSASHAVASDSPTLALTTTLVVADAVQSLASGSPTLTQVHVLAVDDAVQEQTADAVVLVQLHLLLVDDAIQLQTSGVPTLVLVTDVTLIVAMPSDGPTSGTLGGDGPVTSRLGGDGPVTARLPRI